VAPTRYKSDEAGTEAPPGHSCSGVGSPLLPEHTLPPALLPRDVAAFNLPVRVGQLLEVSL
jgi:hypothetical protein